MFRQPPPLKLNRVLIPMVEHMISTSVTLPLEMLEAAMTYTRLTSTKKTIEVHFCALKPEPVTTTGGLRLTPDRTFKQSGIGDLILIPALWRNPIPVVRKHPDIIEWIKLQYDAGAVFAAAGTGVTFMAAAGLLDNKPATTHWFYMEKLQRFFPEVDFKPNHLITRADRIYCAGSVNSVADLMVHLLGVSLGESVAQRVEQQFSHEIRKPFKDTHYADDHTTAHQDEIIVSLQDFIHHQFVSDISIEDMCRLSGLNTRTLNRRFQQATSSAPMEYVRKIRLDQARDLLKNTNLSIAEIALQVGYSDADYFSRLFKRQYQLTPSEFRRSVRGKLFYLND
ncbi:GlxA family transcriptional regulator [Endozoicomonas elysicola]|uniref:GlxA family transcriptional regulator n=1 Tax=Endozoicomonas elysicola TaxID=305900 RepID=UPI0009DAA0D6|nr:helix-turn-helix domain-containing protein [Endozoicomonas elysicola]